MKRADDFRATLTVSHLGAIEHAEIEVRPLTLFFGPNGTNKTWTAYGLYGLLKQLCDPDAVVERAQGTGILNELTQALRGSGVEDRMFQLGTDALSQIFGEPWIGQLDSEAIAGLLGRSQGVTPAAQVGIDLKAGYSLWPNWPATAPDVKTMARLEDRSARIFVSYDRAQFNYSFPKHLDRAAARYTLLEVAERHRSPVIALPAERKALTVLHEPLSALATASLLSAMDSKASMPAPDLALSRAINERRMQAAAKLERSLPRPSIDFIAFLNALAHRTERQPVWSESLARRLEETLLDGAIDFASDARDTLAFTTRGQSIDLHISSSLARAMAGLDLFLRYEATPGSFILIDEPEMNAHPRTQLAIAEFIALMVNHGLRVIATTHSPYIVDHLHNLMEAGRLSPERQQAVAPKFRLGTADAFLDPEQVATWLFTEHGTVENAFDRKHRSIDWQTFSAATDDMANLYSELLVEAGDEVDDDDA